MPNAIAMTPTLEAFFFSALAEVHEREGISLPEDLEAYVVHLLARFVGETGAAGRANAPLSLEYLAARQKAGPDRRHALRDVGDRALYIAGAFPRSLHRTAVDVHYVSSIGEAAYREVHEGSERLAVFGQLADHFEEAAEVIGDVIEGPETRDAERDLLGVYERWRRHGDPRDAKRLVRAGVLLFDAGSDTVQ